MFYYIIDSTISLFNLEVLQAIILNLSTIVNSLISFPNLSVNTPPASFTIN